MVPASACARVDIRLTAGVDTREALGGIRNCLTETDGIEITDISWTRGSYESLGSSIVEASARAADHVVDDRVYGRFAGVDGWLSGLGELLSKIPSRSRIHIPARIQRSV